jgi:hypothetical protein
MWLQKRELYIFVSLLLIIQRTFCYQGLQRQCQPGRLQPRSKEGSGGEEARRKARVSKALMYSISISSLVELNTVKPVQLFFVILFTPAVPIRFFERHTANDFWVFKHEGKNKKSSLWAI